MSWRFVVTDAVRPGSDVQTVFAPLAQMIGDRLGEPVELVRVKDAAAAFDQAAPGARLFGWMSVAQLLDTLDRDLGVVLAMVAEEGQAYYFHPLILTRSELAGVAWPQGAKGRKVLFSGEASLAGWVAPMADLTRQGINPRTHFDLSEGGGLEDCIGKVLTGEADFAATYFGALMRHLRTERTPPESLAVVWRGDPIPYHAMVAHAGMDEADRDRLSAALLGMDADQARAAMPSDSYTGFAPANAGTYAAIGSLIAQFKKDRLIMDGRPPT